MLKGYCGKVMRVNLRTRTTSVEPLKENEVRQLLGGRGIAAKYYYDEIGPGVDASHNYERTHTEALIATTHWIIAYLLSD